MKKKANKNFDLYSAIKNLELFPIIKHIASGLPAEYCVTQVPAGKRISPLSYAKQCFKALEKQDHEKKQVDIHIATKATMIYYALFITVNKQSFADATKQAAEDLALLAALGKSFIKSAHNEQHEFYKLVAAKDFTIWSNFVLEHYINHSFFCDFDRAPFLKENFSGYDFWLIAVWYLSSIHFKKTVLPQSVNQLYNFLKSKKNSSNKRSMCAALEECSYLIIKFNLTSHHMVSPFVHIAQNSSKRDTPDDFAFLTELSDEQPRVQNAGVGSRKKSQAQSNTKKTSGKQNSSPSDDPPESSVTQPKIPEASSDVISDDIEASKSNDLSLLKSKIAVNSKYIDEVCNNISDAQTDCFEKCRIFYKNLVLLNSFFQQGLDLSEINKVFGFPEPEITAFNNKLKTNCINQLIVVLLSSTKDYLSKKSKGTKTKKSVNLFVTESCKLLRVDYSQVHVLQKLYENLQGKGFPEVSLVGGLATLLVQHTLGLVAKVDMTLTSDIDLVLILDFPQRQKLLCYLRSFALTLQKATEDYCSCSIMFEKTKVDLVIYNKSAVRPVAIDSKKSFEVALNSSVLKFARYRDIILLFNKERLFDKRALTTNACALAYYLREHARDKFFSFVPSFADVSRDNPVIFRQAVGLYLTKYVYSTQTIFYSYFSDKLIRFIPGFEGIKAIIHSISEVLLAVDNANSKKNYLPFTMIMLNFFENKKPVPTNNFPKGIEIMANIAIKELTGKGQEQKAIIAFIKKSKSALK